MALSTIYKIYSISYNAEHNNDRMIQMIMNYAKKSMICSELNEKR